MRGFALSSIAARWGLRSAVALPLAAALVAGAAPAEAGRLKATAELVGEQEVPPVETLTRGKVQIEFNSEMTKANYRLEVKSGTRLTQAHIHCGLPGATGPVTVFLAGLIAQGVDVNGRWIQSTTITDQNVIDVGCGSTLVELIEAMKQGRTYVNVHSVANPPGEVRGQLEIR